MGLASSVLREIDRITDESNWENYKKALPKHQLKFFHDAIEQRAYFAAEYDGFKQTPEDYWKSAKASVALEIVGKLEGVNNPRFTPNPSMLPIDKADSELIYSALRFEAVQTNLNMYISCKVKDYFRKQFRLT